MSGTRFENRRRTKSSQATAVKDCLAPRKLPRQLRATETVNAILEAAAVILESDGFEGYNTNAIAERAGVSIGSLYQYFPNKASLTRALIAREDRELISNLSPLLIATSGFDLLDSFISICVAHELRRPLLARLLDVEEARHPPSIENLALTELVWAILERYLGKAAMVREPFVAQDLLAIVQGMADGADRETVRLIDGLADRIGRAVHGYLGTFGRSFAKSRVASGLVCPLL